MTDPVWTLSNGLSALRLLLAYPIAVMMLRNDGTGREWLFALLALAILTDFFDGVAARRLHQVTETGKILDPLADKIVIGTISFILMRHSVIPVWFFIAVFARDLMILGGGVYLRKTYGLISQSNILGKWTVTVTAAFLVVALAGGGKGWMFTALLSASCALLVLSSISYLKRFAAVTHLSQPPAHAQGE